MKPKELMIGDWVKAPAGNMQIGIIDPDFIYWDKIQPIPLTPEILEKNGFIFDKNRKAYLMGLVFQLHQRFDESFYLNGVQCLSICAVHELQHALKLCGIEKEIEI